MRPLSGLWPVARVLQEAVAGSRPRSTQRQITQVSKPTCLILPNDNTVQFTDGVTDFLQATNYFRSNNTITSSIYKYSNVCHTVI